MANIPAGLWYTEEHEYVKSMGGNRYRIGITDYAQGELGDIVYVDLPKAGQSFKRMDVFGTVEAVKAVSDLYSPVSGQVAAANTALADDPALVNREPYDGGWMIEVTVADDSEIKQLMDAEKYSAHVGA